MHDVSIPSGLRARYLPRSKGALFLSVAMVAIGAAAFAVLLGTDPNRAWQAYVANWLFFTSVAMGGIILCAVTTITKARWNWSVRRITLSFGSFLPFSFLLLIPMLLFLREDYFHWIEEIATDEILQRKAAYLNIPFLVVRNAVGALVLFSLSFLFMARALRPDLAPDRAGDEEGDGVRARWRNRLSGGWRGQEEEEARSWSTLTKLSPALVLVYAVVMSIFVIDWAMTLLPHWLSTMLPGWFFMGAFWTGILATALTSILLRRSDPYLQEHIGPDQFHDLGKASFAFSVFWAYLFFAQYLVIWYGKLPWEQEWIVMRSGPEWGPLSLLVIGLCFIVPFAALIGRRPKLIPWWLGGVAALALTGVWLERFLLIAPSLHEAGTPTITFWEPLIALGFLGVFAGGVRWFLSTFPVVQLWQPRPEPEMVEAESPVTQPS